jgi:hypothetical protein
MTKARGCAMLGAGPPSKRGRPMSTVQPFRAGGYRFIGHQFQYSGGVTAEPGFRIERARFTRPVPLAAGFDAIEPTSAASDARRPRSVPASGVPRGNSTTLGSSRSVGIMSSGLLPGGFSATMSTPLPARMSARKSTRPRRRRSTPSATPCRADTARRPACLQHPGNLGNVR